MKHCRKAMDTAFVIGDCFENAINSLVLSLLLPPVPLTIMYAVPNLRVKSEGRQGSGGVYFSSGIELCYCMSVGSWHPPQGSPPPITGQSVQVVPLMQRRTALLRIQDRPATGMTLRLPHQSRRPLRKKFGWSALIDDVAVR
eukprot:scaffold429004_cov36-Prasinocladus_malaysianus.AAC.2